MSAWIEPADRDLVADYWLVRGHERQRLRWTPYRQCWSSYAFGDIVYVSVSADSGWRILERIEEEL